MSSIRPVTMVTATSSIGSVTGKSEIVPHTVVDNLASYFQEVITSLN